MGKAAQRNKPGHRCLDCGRELRRVTHHWFNERERQAAREKGAVETRVNLSAGDRRWGSYYLPDEPPGYSANGFFCTLTCGFRWAVKQLRKADRRKL